MQKTILFLFLLLSSWVYGQENLTFQKPSAEILALADYQRPPTIRVSPDKAWILFMYRPTYKSLEELGQEEMRLAGLRINAKTKASSTESYVGNLRLKQFASDREFDIKGLPENARIANISFSPDAKKIAFTHTNAHGLALWIIDVATQQAKQLTDYDLNAVLDGPYRWFRDSERLLINKLSSDMPPLVDRSNELPTGPVVSSSAGQVS